MDMFAVDSGDMAASVGDTVTLLGGELPASEVADRRKTIEYTALTCWHGRADRIYVNDKSGSENVSQTKGVMPE